jgi:hypothetical protein
VREASRMSHTLRQCDHDADRQARITFNEHQQSFRNADPPHYSKHNESNRPFIIPSLIPGRRAATSSMAHGRGAEVTMTGGVQERPASAGVDTQGVELFGTSRYQQAYAEFWQENQPIVQMETAPAQLQPDLQVSVQQLSESRAAQAGGRGPTRQRRKSWQRFPRSCIGCQRLSETDTVSMRCGVFGQ